MRKPRLPKGAVAYDSCAMRDLVETRKRPSPQTYCTFWVGHQSRCRARKMASCSSTVKGSAYLGGKCVGSGEEGGRNHGDSFHLCIMCLSVGSSSRYLLLRVLLWLGRLLHINFLRASFFDVGVFCVCEAVMNGHLITSKLLKKNNG